MYIKKTLVYFLVLTHVLTTGCVTTGDKFGFSKIGPKLSSEYEEGEDSAEFLSRPKLEVVIPVFDPGLSDKAKNYEEEGIWPELRRAEANRFAYKLKLALEKTRVFGAVRVTPNQRASGDLYILGEIKKSDGAEVAFNLEVVDISGREWMDKSFDHEVTEAFYKDPRNLSTQWGVSNKDPYDPVFDEAAKKIVSLLKKRSTAELSDLQYISNLRFGANFTQDAFMQHLKIDDKKITLVSKPSDNDPMLQRVSSIRVREQMFVDGMQQNYADFSNKMDDSYWRWQEASLTEMKLKNDAERQAMWKALAGVLLIGLSVAAAASGNSSGDPYYSGPSPAASTAAVTGAIGGAWMLSESFKNVEEAKLHRNALNELGGSINLEFSPQVVEFENETVQLTGDAEQQFSQWRLFLQSIFEQESTPDVML